MLRKKKGISAVGVIIALAIGVFLLFATIPIIKNFFGKGRDQGNLAIYKTKCDYDFDKITIGDSCPCDYGKVEDSKMYWLKDTPACVVAPMKDTPDKYQYSKDLSTSDEKKCKSSFDKLVIAANSQESGSCDANSADKFMDGFTQKCANKILQMNPETNNFATRCKTPDKDCDDKLLDYCKGKA